MEKIPITHFSDILCVWAYVAERRIEELEANLPDQIDIEYRTVQVFGNVGSKLQDGWAHRGGVDAYSKHVHSVTAQFDHLDIHPDIWRRNTPTSSMACHHFLCAARVVDQAGALGTSPAKLGGALRRAFFSELADISSRAVQFEIAEALRLPIAALETALADGSAMAALWDDLQLAKSQAITLSPTLLFNEGRQKLAGNIGYRVIEANIRELLNHPPQEPAWC